MEEISNLGIRMNTSGEQSNLVRLGKHLVARALINTRKPKGIDEQSA
jgi:hypothetical protein